VRPDVQSKRSANVGAAERGLAAVLGLALGAAGLVGLARRRGLSGIVMSLAGGALLFHGAKRHSLLYDRLGVTDEDVTPTAHPLRRQIHIRRSVTIGRPVEQVYGFWRNLENLPKVMEKIESVTPIDDRRVHWVANLPVVGRIEWDSEITDDQPNQRIAWSTVNPTVFDQRGAVSFKPTADGSGTEVTSEMVLRLRGGAISVALGKVLGQDPENILARNLHRAKQLLETGEVATNAGPSCRS
jgi:uncharacterized membrane protein